MLAEELAAGGSARNLWVKIDLPENPGELLDWITLFESYLR
jgi:hypothetical protein